MYMILAALFTLHPGHDAMGCGALTWDGAEQGTVRESENRVLMELMEVYRRRSSVDIPITLCESSAGASVGTVPLPAAQIHTEGMDRRGFIHIPSKVIEEFNVSALGGLLAHELAHMTIPKTPDCLLLPLRLDPVTVQERAACQIPADVKAVQWAGQEPVLTFLEAMYGLLAPYSESEHERHELREELDLRLQTVQSNGGRH